MGITIKKGQFFTSIAHLSGDLGLTNKQIRISIDKLKLTGEISLNLAKAANEWLEVENASLETDIPGELGINMAGAK